ncbi:MAG: GNAT family N-acetyltransferase [Phycisphaeraceae bacterium]|nr:GNAT family N-acetyltransferase [Phycisphaeraceae bacterium]
MQQIRPTVLRIGTCTREEAGELLADHYAPGSPTRVCALLGARLEIAGETRLVGVLAVTYPTLNDRWREKAWPGVYDIADKRERAKKLNATVRRIARVVVVPQQRGRGIATALVRAYLRRPLTERTEAVAAMGDFCGCFASAGMRAVECAPSERDTRLARALKELRIRPETLADDRAAERLLANGEFVRAIRAWANSAGATRKWLERADAIQMLAPMAARGVVEKKRVVWVAEAGAGRDKGAEGQREERCRGGKVPTCRGGCKGKARSTPSVIASR